MHGGEWSLIAFTLLTQASVGIHFFSLLLPAQDETISGDSLSGRIKWPGMYNLGLLLLFPALAAGFFHLGSPENAVHALNQIKTSWLSREIAFFILYGVASLLYFWARFSKRAGRKGAAAAWIVTSFLGVFLILSMSALYMLPSVPVWNSWTTPASFLLSTLLLGGWTALRYLSLKVPNRGLPIRPPDQRGTEGSSSTLKRLAGWMISLTVAGHLLHYLFYLKIRSGFVSAPYELSNPFVPAAIRTAFLLIAFLCLGGTWNQLRRGGNLSPPPRFWIYSAGAALLLSEITGRILFYAVYVRSGL